MINIEELRIGNTVLHKASVRILPTQLTLQHFEALSKNGTKDFFPVVLKADVLQKCGFTENKNYPGLPTSREFSLPLPVPGEQKTEVFAWIKTNGECFGRVMTDGKAISRNVYHLHQLQNLIYAITGTELEVML
jgi:hypothetical protein